MLNFAKDSSLWARHAAKRDYPLLLIILLLATFLRLNNLNKYGLWLDEVSYAIAAQAPIINQIIDPVGSLGNYLSVDPTLSAIPFSLALKLGFSNFLARFPAALFGILSVAFIYRLGRTLFGNTVGVIAALLLATSSFHIYYSQEGRSYAQFIFFCIASFLLFYRAINVNKAKTWILYSIVTWLGVSTNHLMILTVAVQGIVILLILIQKLIQKRVTFRLCRRTFINFCLSITAIFLLRTPWLSDFTQRACYGCDIGQPSQPLALATNFRHSIEAFVGISPNIALPFILLAVFGLLIALYRNSIQGLLLIGWLLLSITVTIIALWFISQFYHPRYTIWGLPAFVLAISCGVVGIDSGLRQIFNRLFPKIVANLQANRYSTALIALLILPLIIGNLAQIQQHPVLRQHSPRGQLQDAANLIINKANSNDTVIAIGLPARHLRFYIEPHRVDLEYFDDTLFVQKDSSQALPASLGGRWYVLHNSYTPPNIPDSWTDTIEYYNFFDLVVVHLADDCALAGCIADTKTLLTQIAEVNPNTHLATTSNNILAGLEILELK